MNDSTKENALKALKTQDHHDGFGLNDSLLIYADERDPAAGNASHKYEGVLTIDGEQEAQIVVQFQHGPRDEPGSAPGATDAALITILLDRYRGFQAGPFACRENALVITKLEESLLWMKSRAFKRAQQGVLGKNEVHES